MDRISEVLKTMTDWGTDTHPPGFVGHAHGMSSIEDLASKYWKTGF